MSLHKSLIGNKGQSINNFGLYGSKAEKRLNNIKKLADEMVKMIVDKKRKEAEERLNDETIFYDVDVQNYKHKSQIFINRNHHQLLRNFSLAKSNEDNNALKPKNSIIRRKNKQITAQNNIFYSKNKISFHLSFKNNNEGNYNDINEEEKKSEDNKIIKSGLDSCEDKFSKKSGEDKQILNNIEPFDSSRDIDYETEKNDNNKDDVDNIEIIYENPSKMTAKEKEELSTKNDEEKINDEERNFGQKHNIGKYLFEKGMKMINLRNKKIEKTKEIRENKTKNFFDIKNYVNKNNKKISPKKSNFKKKKEKNYIPLHYKAGELYKYHLAKIELSQKNSQIEKEIQAKKEMKKINKQKLNKLNEKTWNNFLDREKQWKQNNINIKKESLKKKEKKDKNKIYDRPKINRKSIIMLEQKETSNKLKKNNNVNKRYINSITPNRYNNIYTKLYKDKDIYDTKLKNRIYYSMPTFSPIIIDSKMQKSLTKNNNKSKKNKTPNKIRFDYKRKAEKKGIVLNDANNNHIKKLVSSISTKQINQRTKNQIRDKKANSKKTFVFELNINNSNYSNKIDNQNIKTPSISSYIKKLGESASKKFRRNKKNIYQKNLSDNNLLSNKNQENNRNTFQIKNNNLNLFDKENIEINVKDKKKKEIEINNDTKFLYNINLSDHTSNNKKQFVVLTSKKYIDFFK